MWLLPFCQVSVSYHIPKQITCQSKSYRSTIFLLFFNRTFLNLLNSPQWCDIITAAFSLGVCFMNLHLLKRIAAVGLIAIIVCAVVNIIVTIVGKNNSVTAMPLGYKLLIEICCWSAIIIVGSIIYFVLKKHAKT